MAKPFPIRYYQGSYSRYMFHSDDLSDGVMALFLILCLEWGRSLMAAQPLPPSEAIQTYQSIMARHKELEYFWLGLSGRLKIYENASSNHRPTESKIFI